MEEFVNNFIPENWGEDPYEYEPGVLERIDNPEALYRAYLLSRKNVNWKTSVQRYGLNLLSNIYNTRLAIENGTYVPAKPYEFILNERGHKRFIKANTIADRVVQRSVNDNVLNPVISKLLIYDNGASQTGKGITFARNEFKKHFYHAFLEYGCSGYILIIDFSKYFDNIVHSIILEYIKDLVSPDEFIFIEKLFDQFKIDVSYMDVEEYEDCLNNLFNSLEHDLIDKSLLTGDKFMDKSMGIGNQLSQIVGVYYPHRIDNFCKIVKSRKYYGRYMDDIYIFGKSKEELYDLLKDINYIAQNELKIHINTKKTRIQPMYSQITYLKINYIITPTGKIIEKVLNETIKREINRIYMFKKLYMSNKMTLSDIIQSFLSWYGSYILFDSKSEVNYVMCVFKIVFNIDKDINLEELLKYLHNEERTAIMNNVLDNYYT